MRYSKRMIFLLIAFCMASSLCCTAYAAGNSGADATEKSAISIPMAELSEFNGKRIGLQAGSTEEVVAAELLFNTILPRMKKEDEVMAEFENVRYEEKVTMTVTGDVITADILDHADEVSRGLIMHSADSIDIKEGKIIVAF